MEMNYYTIILKSGIEKAIKQSNIQRSIMDFTCRFIFLSILLICKYFHMFSYSSYGKTIGAILGDLREYAI